MAEGDRKVTVGKSGNETQAAHGSADMQAGVGTLQPTRRTDRSPDAVGDGNGDGDRDLHQCVNMEQIINYAQDERETVREKEGETQSVRQESWSDLSDILY